MRRGMAGLLVATALASGEGGGVGRAKKDRKHPRGMRRATRAEWNARAKARRVRQSEAGIIQVTS